MKYFITEKGIVPFRLSVNKLMALLCLPTYEEEVSWEYQINPKRHLFKQCMKSDCVLFKHPEMSEKMLKRLLGEYYAKSSVYALGEIRRNRQDSFGEIVYLVHSISVLFSGCFRATKIPKTRFNALMRKYTIDSILKDLTQ